MVTDVPHCGDVVSLFCQSSIFYHCYLHLVIRKPINPLNAKLNPICYLLALLGAHPILHVSRRRVNMGGYSIILNLVINMLSMAELDAFVLRVGNDTVPLRL